MNKMTIEMPIVSQCSATQCAYNKELKCHAKAITVGDGNRAGCDTYFQNSTHTQESKRQAGVGACKVVNCQHNRDFECAAQSIQVAIQGQSVNCGTYSPRQSAVA